MKKHKTLQDKAAIAMKEAIREVIENHRRTGRPLAIWKNGKVVKVPAARLTHHTKSR